MGLRFRRSVRIFPGVRLNFSRSGISTTFGGRGASVTVGRRGSHLNLGLPGTGISYRERLTPAAPGPTPPVRITPPSPASHASPPLAPAPVFEPAARTSLPGEIRSGGSDEITSISLKELRDLLAEAWAESKRLKAEVPPLDAELKRARQKAYKWENGILLKHLMKRKYASILEAYEQARSERKALSAEIEKCRVALEIEMEGGIDTTYGTMVEAFRALAACEKCWDTTSEVGVDQVRERSRAATSVTRSSVVLDMTPSDVIAPSRPAMHLQNANGGDLFVLPGLLLVFGSHADFGLIRLQEVRLEYSSMQFLESQGIPADSRRVGETWAKVNKDGSRDRRFANNYVIPIVEYGELTFKSAAGLNERYLFSCPPKPEAFARAFAAHKAALPV